MSNDYDTDYADIYARIRRVEREVSDLYDVMSEQKKALQDIRKVALDVLAAVEQMNITNELGPIVPSVFSQLDADWT